MSRSSTPSSSSSSQYTVPAPRVNAYPGIRIHRIIRDINVPNPPRPLSLTECTRLSYFQFETPYARDDYVTLFNQFYLLVGRVPITSQDVDPDLEFLAILIHQGDAIEETILLPVPASFFQDPFYPEEPPPRSMAPSPTPTPSPSPSPAPPYVFPPPYIAAQLGIVPIPPQRTCWSQFKAMVIAQRMQIFCYLMIIIIFIILIVVLIFQFRF